MKSSRVKGTKSDKIRAILNFLFSAMIVISTVSVLGIVGGLECDNLSLKEAVIEWALASVILGLGVGGRYVLG